MELAWVALSFLAVIALERTRLRRLPARFLRPHFAADLTFFATGIVALGLAMRSGAQLAAGALGVPPLIAWPPLAAFALTLALYDLGAWLAHRAMHRFEFLWRAHKVHHASPQLDWLAAFRMHPLEHGIRHAISPVLLILLGFPALHIALASILSGAWAAFVHANLHVGPRALEWLFVTPRLHHLHHIPATCERNFGAVLSLWDRLAGVLTREFAPRNALLGVPGEEHTFPHGWWEQVRGLPR
jgi:sterol desaturase/sphingolipid hydroxylase (fatty acid hydroxylase superfamily)